MPCKEESIVKIFNETKIGKISNILLFTQIELIRK